MFIKKYNRCLRPTQIHLYALDGVSGPVHAPAELTPLHNEQEDGWGQQTVGTIQTVKKKKIFYLRQELYELNEEAKLILFFQFVQHYLWR